MNDIINNKREVISFDKILKRIKSICKEFNLTNIIYAQLTMKVIDQIYDNIETKKTYLNFSPYQFMWITNKI